jgi:hypothetical protein
MSTSYSVSGSVTFSRSHAGHIATRVSADLKRIQRFYEKPSDAWIDAYETELVELMVDGYLEEVTYGFQRNGMWIVPTLVYTARDLYGSTGTDNDPGRIRPRADVSGAGFTSFLTHNNAWMRLTQSQREAFQARLPFQRGSGSEPGVEGYLESDNTYSAGGRALDRRSVRGYGQ